MNVMKTDDICPKRATVYFRLTVMPYPVFIKGGDLSIPMNTLSDTSKEEHSMKSKQLLEDLEFHDVMPFAQPIMVDVNSRILRWTLKPGQKVEEHQVPDSPLYAVIIKGRGMFAGGDGQEREYGLNDLLIFAPGEKHTVRALDDELVFVSFLRSVDTMRTDRVGGEIGRE